MPWYRHFLWPFAILYGLAVWFRNRLFDIDLLISKRFDVPIICVGNLEAGGTGKSPIVIYLVNLLRSNGMNVATLSRGYGRKTTGFLFADSDSSSAEIGDEAKQLKTRFPDIAVAVSENRVKGVKRLLSSKVSPDVIIMDDGFQHRWLKPSLSILVTSGKFPFWKNSLLPVGTLREAKNEGKRADVLVLSNGEGNSRNVFFDGPVFRSETMARKPSQIHGKKLKADELDKVVLLSGIGNSMRFENTANQQFEVLDHVTFSDHHNFSLSEFKLLRKKIDSFGAAVSAVLTTEKDAMRILGSPLLNELGQIALFYLPIDVKVIGEEILEFDEIILEHVRKDK